VGKRFKTGSVARLVGIPAPLLRMWETRYRLVSPQRGPGGQRMYSEGDIDLLRAARALVSRGFAIGELARWSRDEMLGAVREPTLTPSTRAVTAVPADGLAILVALGPDGIISTISPGVEALLGWPHNLLAGQPIWGLMLDIPPALERLASGTAPPAEGTVCWVWLRSRTGGLVPCRFACGKLRRTTEGTTLTVSITPLFAEGEPRLSPLLDNVDGGGLVRFAGNREQLLREYVHKCVDEQAAALARVWTFDERDGTLHLVASAGLSKAVAGSPRSVIRLAGYPFKVGVVARTAIPYIHNGLDGDRDFERAWIKREKLESAAVLPLIAGGKLVGVTAQFFRKPLAAHDVGRLQASAALCESWLHDHQQPIAS
jgi:PAS domain-containing protein